MLQILPQFTNDERLERFMPHPEETMNGGGLYCECVLSEMELSHQQDDIDKLVQYKWRFIYEMAIRKVTGIIMGRTEHFIIRYIPTAYHYISLGMPSIKLRVIYELMVVPTKEYILPVFTYSEMSHIPFEWKCGYCASPNEIKERHCTQCGAPRALLLQELSN